MAQRLSLVRHAEAAHTAAGSLDRHRALTEAGRTAARALGAYLAKEGTVPDQILCSDAVRAVDTTHLLLAGAGTERPVVVLDELYGADPGRIVLLVQENADENAEHVMVVGHNPSIGVLAQDLVEASGQSQTVGGPLGHFAPASCAMFAVRSLDWEGFHRSHAELRRVVTSADYAVD